MSYRIAVLASGRGSNFLALQAAIAAGDLSASLVGVFSDKATAPVLAHAQAAGVVAQSLSPKDFPDRLQFDLALLDAVAQVRPDLVVCAGYMRILDAAALAPWIGRMINIHPSLLPKYPGLHTHRRALAAGDDAHGASVHFVTAELDGGPVIAQARVPIAQDDNEAALAARVLAREHPLLLACVAGLGRGEIAWCAPTVCFRGHALQQPLQLDADNRLHR